MSHNKFWEITHFIQYDMRATRSQLITDKFAHVSEVSDPVIKTASNTEHRN